MKPPSIARVRIPILVALAIGETIGLIHYFGRWNFTQFLAMSSFLAFLIVPLLWLEFIRQIKASFPIFFLTPLTFISLANSWRGGHTGFTITWAIFFLLVITLVLIRIYIEFRKGKHPQGGRA